MASLIKTPWGRLCTEQYGALDGTPVLYFHGQFGSRLEARLWEKPARELGIRLIATDLPGFGGSDFQPGRRVEDWPDAVEALADHLGLESFSVLGVSAGGKYAAACARRLYPRVRTAALVCSFGPLGPSDALQGAAVRIRLTMKLYRWAPAFGDVLCTAVARILQGDVDRILQRLDVFLQPAERRALADPEIRSLVAASLRESVRSGHRGVAHEFRLMCRPWGFPLADVRAPVTLWHGERDRIAPAGMGRFQASAIPECEPHFVAEQGHLSLLVWSGGDVLRALRPLAGQARV